jgi:hypothetical protein
MRNIADESLYFLVLNVQGNSHSQSSERSVAPFNLPIDKKGFRMSQPAGTYILVLIVRRDQPGGSLGSPSGSH